MKLAVLLLGASLLQSISAQADDLLLCPAESAPVAAVKYQEILHPDGRRSQLLQLGRPLATPPGCTRLPLPAGLPPLQWAALRPEPALPAAGLALQGQATASGFAVSEIILPAVDEGGGADASAAAAPVLPCTLPARGADAPKEAPRGAAAWFWSPAVWADHPEQVWAWQQRLPTGLARIFITVPVVDDAVRLAPLLAAFVTAARARGIAVWAVGGDPHDVLPASLPALQARLAAYARYNQTVDESARLAGVQLDIEPYLLPGYALAPAAWRQRYLDMLRALRPGEAGRLPLDLVLPVWWATDPAWGEQFLCALAGEAVSLTVMNYRSDPETLRAAARPFLDWGERHGRAVTMALELGPIDDEQRRHFQPAAAGSAETAETAETAGELWALPFAGGQVLALFARPVAGLPGQSWRESRHSLAPGGQISFARSPERLAPALARVLPAWRRSPAFAGLAWHGLETFPSHAIDAAGRFEDDPPPPHTFTP